MAPAKEPAKTIPGEMELIAKSRKGDKEAFRALVLAYQDRIFNLVLSMVRNREQAEDLTQNIFVKVYFALPLFKGDSAFYTWAYRISSNACLDYLRKHKHPEVSLDQTFSAEDSLTRGETLRGPSSERPEAGLEGDLSHLLGLINPDQRLILTLRETEGYSYEEISEILKCAVNTVKSRINRAREALKHAYNEKYGNILTTKTVEKSEEKP